MTVTNYRTQWFSSIGEARRDVLAGLVVALALAPLTIAIAEAERLRAWLVYELLKIPRPGRDHPWRPE